MDFYFFRFRFYEILSYPAKCQVAFDSLNLPPYKKKDKFLIGCIQEIYLIKIKINYLNTTWLFCSLPPSKKTSLRNRNLIYINTNSS